MRRIPPCFIIPWMVITLTGCATFSGKMSAGTQADIGYFTDATVTMMKDVNFGFTRGSAIYVKEFIVLTEPEEVEYLKTTTEVDKVIKGIVRYSLKLVSISESSSNESEQVQQYADYLAQMQGPISTALNLPTGHYEQMIREVRGQKTMLGALRKAQPLMNGMGQYMEQTLTKADAATAVLAKKLDQKIDARYAEVIAYQNALDREKYDSLRAISNIYKAIRNEKGAYEALLKSEQIRDPSLIPTGRPTYNQYVSMTKYLFTKFDVMHKIQEEIEPDWNTYRETHRERQRLENHIHQEVKQFRLVTMTWVRAHQKMSAGKTKPAEWFDFNEAAMKGLKAGIGLVL